MDNRLYGWLVTATGSAVVALGMLLFVAALMGYPVKWLWNTTVPELFSTVPQIGFWEAVRLTFLCGLLFKSSIKVDNS